jgi:hypothetical protein
LVRSSSRNVPLVCPPAPVELDPVPRHGGIGALLRPFLGAERAGRTSASASAWELLPLACAIGQTDTTSRSSVTWRRASVPLGGVEEDQIRRTGGPPWRASGRRQTPSMVILDASTGAETPETRFGIGPCPWGSRVGATPRRSPFSGPPQQHSEWTAEVGAGSSQHEAGRPVWSGMAGHAVAAVRVQGQAPRRLTPRAKTMRPEAVRRKAGGNAVSPVRRGLRASLTRCPLPLRPHPARHEATRVSSRFPCRPSNGKARATPGGSRTLKRDPSSGGGGHSR